MKMKPKITFLSIILILVFITGCVGDASFVGEEHEVSLEGFDFTEEEANELTSEEGLEFTDNKGLSPESQGFDFSEEEANEGSGMDFDGDEPLKLPDVPDHLLPPEGSSNWLITHDNGTATCPNNTIVIWGRQPETIKITVGAEDVSLVVSGMEGGSDMLFLFESSGIGGSIYNGYVQPPGASSEFHYQLVFTSSANDLNANYVMGSITGEEQGCRISRSFEGNRID
jgi:hypothetical protein